MIQIFNINIYNSSISFIKIALDSNSKYIFF